MSQNAIGQTDWEEVRHNLDSQNIKLVLAFPGTGKTNCVKGLRSTGKRGAAPVAADFDIKGVGNDRARVQLIPKTQKAMGNLVAQMMRDKVIVFSFLNYFNEDALDPSAGSVLVVVPKATKDEWADRIAKRGDSDEFVQTVRDEFDSWRSNWLARTGKLMKRMHVFVAACPADQYLSQVLEQFPDSATVFSPESGGFIDYVKDVIYEVVGSSNKSQ